MFRYAKGGGNDWGTMCGALNACLAVLNLAVPNYDVLGHELTGWYTRVPLPLVGARKLRRIQEPGDDGSHSPLCHLFVSTWVNKAGARIHDKAKKDRCAKLSGDTAAMAAGLLNAALENKLKLVYTPAKEYSHCLTCHQAKRVCATTAKLNCLPCRHPIMKTKPKPR